MDGDRSRISSPGRQRLVIHGRLGRKTDHIGSEIRSDEEFEAVREAVVPLHAIAGASVRRRWWEWRRVKLVLTATDLRSFEKVAGGGGLRLEHPAQLVLRIRTDEQLAAEEFSAELALAVAELDGAGSTPGLSGNEDRPALPHNPI